MFSRVDTSKEILSDQGANFMSSLLKEMYVRLPRIQTSPYHPQTDELTECFNSALKAILRKFVNKKGKEWDEYIPYILFAYV